MVHFLKASFGIAICALCLVTTPGIALSETAQMQIRELMATVALREATERYDEALEVALTAIEIAHLENEPIPLRLSQKTIDLFWINGRDSEAITLCDSIINSLVYPRNEQKLDLGLAVWKRSLVAIGREEGFSKRQKIHSARVINISALNHFSPCGKKKSISNFERPMILLASFTQEEVQEEYDTALEKEIQSWVDAKDCVKEALDQNLGSAIEKAGESVIHHWEGMYHEGKALKMELDSHHERENDSNDQGSSSTCEPGSYEDRWNRD